MEAWEILLIVTVAAFIFVLPYFVFRFLIKPNKYRSEMDAFKNVRYAHRGLHSESVPENSIEAFSLAVEAGYGIELDVRLSSDGELVVFHDDTLDRMTSELGRVDGRTAEELTKIKLRGTENTVPTFREVLKLVDGKVPLLVEIKEDAGKYGVTEKTVEMLKQYNGPFIVESFNPLSLGRVKKLAPEFMRGFLSQNFYKEEKYRRFMYFLLQNMLLNFICRPDFIAYSHKDSGMKVFNFIRKHHRKTPLIAWTLESLEEDATAINNGFCGIIFQYYQPEALVSGKSEVV
ncbi:MAG: glycerophosphodiester phosphodiesterase [Clostridia bacterium]|nr:glycerophosphodiester phosphodiesterase [Clostridia bacterium]